MREGEREAESGIGREGDREREWERYKEGGEREIEREKDRQRQMGGQNMNFFQQTRSCVVDVTSGNIVVIGISFTNIITLTP